MAKNASMKKTTSLFVKYLTFSPFIDINVSRKLIVSNQMVFISKVLPAFELVEQQAVEEP